MTEPIWIAGRAEGGSGEALVARVSLTWSGQDDPPPVTATTTPFDVVTDDGARIRVTASRDVVLAPERKHKGPWRDVQGHPARPSANRDMHPDGEVTLTGAWIVAGDRVAVYGDPTDARFVPDSGGPRESAVTRPSAIAARAIGVGDGARAAVEDALAERDRASRRAATRGSIWSWLKQPWHAAGVCAALAAAMLPLQLFGSALLLFHLAVVWTWAAVPCVDVPGGAANEGDRNKASLVALMNTFFAPMLLLVSLGGPVVGTTLRNTDAFGAAMLIFVIIFELLAIVRALLARPRVEPDYQLELPAHRGLRAALVLVIVGIGVATAAWAGTVHDFSGDGPMT